MKEGCGKVEKGKFEFEYGKGIVVWLIFYFLICYYNKIDFLWVDFFFLLKWYEEFIVLFYEKYCNVVIFEL